jgi:hypothetical protein
VKYLGEQIYILSGTYIMNLSVSYKRVSTTVSGTVANTVIPCLTQGLCSLILLWMSELYYARAWS